MPMSAELPVQSPVADGRKQIDWARNHALKMSAISVVVAIAAVFVVVLVAAAVTLPTSTLDIPAGSEFLIGP